MQNENIFKMSAMADTELKDVPTLNILICYLLYKIGKPVNTEHLYEILIGTEVVNYFCYIDSLDYLLTNGHITVEPDENGGECYVLQPKGTACARELKNYAPKSYRDKLMLSALRYIARIRNEKEIEIEYIPIETGGCYVHVRCLEKMCDLMDLKLYAPDMTQAKLLGERIMLDPAGFYGKVIGLALSNEEVPYDLSDV